jgi:hypothetical protein
VSSSRMVHGLSSASSFTELVTDITAAQHVWRTVMGAGFKCPHILYLNHDPVEYTFGAVRSYPGSMP